MELKQLIFQALIDDPPVNPKNGGVIRSVYNSGGQVERNDRSREDWIKDWS